MRGFAMMLRTPAGLPVLTGILAVSFVRPAFAEETSCPAMTLHVDASVSARWPGLLNQVREAFEARDDIDRCARVRLTPGEDSVMVEVMLQDGRSAARPVSRQGDVVPTLEALLLVPQRAAQPQTPAADPSASGSPAASSPSTPLSEASPAGPREAPAPHGLAAPDGDASAVSPGHRASRLRIELSVVTGARVGDGQASVGLGAFSFLDLSGWLVGLEGRADRYRELSGETPGAGVLEVAVLAGRRFRFRNTALDLIAGPAGVLQGTTTFERQSTSNGGTDVTGSSSSTVPRLLLGARMDFSALATVHTFVGLDGEIGPPRAGDGGEVPEVPRLPVWTLGLALGATVGTP
jgi:hypothetical protein